MRPDGRVVAWTEWGAASGSTVLRVPGTPGCRWSVPQDTAVWEARGLRVLTSERPGFGRSSRLPGRGFAEHADDLAAVLDAAGVASAYLIGPSGAAPHVLAFCQAHGDRVVAATILVGSAPMSDEEAAGMLAVNQRGRDLARSQDRGALTEFLAALRESILHDATDAFERMMSDAPLEDRDVLADPEAVRSLVLSLEEALAAGVDGWVDETIALLGDWADIEPERITTPITWYHGTGDRNCPFTAAARLVRRIPNGHLIEWPHDAGHLHGQQHDAAILDELLSHA